MQKPKNGIHPQNSNSKLPLFSLMFGVGSIAGLLISIALALTIEVIGAVSLFRGLVLPLSFAAIFIGAIAANKISEDDLKGRTQARVGIILGVVAFGLIILGFLAAAVIFIPLRLLGA